MVDVKTAVRKPGEICEVRIEGLTPQLNPTLILEQDGRGSSDIRRFLAAELEAGAQWELQAGVIYLLRLELSSAIGPGECWIIITFLTSEGEKSTFFQGICRADDRQRRWRIKTWSPRPLQDRILARRIDGQETFPGGVIIPDASKEISQEVEVVSTGPGKKDNRGGRIPMAVHSGDRLLIGKYSGSEVKIGEEVLMILREDEILAVIEDDSAERGGHDEDPLMLEGHLALGVEPGGFGFDEVEHRPLVNSGFATLEEPAMPISPREPLVHQTHYYFWFEIGEQVAGALQTERTPFEVADLPPKAEFQVVLFAFEGEIDIEPGLDVGTLELQPERTVVVLKAVISPPPLVDHELLNRRLFFPVAMPQKPGFHRLRCNVYYRQVLLQSHLVSVEVVLPGTRAQRQPALESVLDFQISERLRADLLDNIQEHRLSVMLNDNGNGTHGFRFFGSDGREVYKRDATIPEGELTSMIFKARARLRVAMWGDEHPYDRQEYTYRDGDRNLERLRKDLIDLGKWGRRFYGSLSDRLAGSGRPIEREERRLELRNLLASPGRLQMVSKDSLRQVIPTALMHDYELAENLLDYQSVKLCETFQRSLDQPVELDETPCFQGKCPSRDDSMVVCPGGFWGFRHDLGNPPTVPDDPDYRIVFDDRPNLLMAVWKGKDFKMRQGHEADIQTMAGDGWSHAETYDETMAGMKADASQVVYFYCHGGLSDDVPYLRVGSQADVKVITKDALNAVFFRQHSPLVFINGCHTTQLDPEKVLDLASGFLNRNAAGVIGTEITIFEPLACSFGAAFLRRFLAGIEVGRAIRLARLDLLKQGNPLGLVYIPFVLSSSRLEQRTSSGGVGALRKQPTPQSPVTI